MRAALDKLRSVLVALTCDQHSSAWLLREALADLEREHAARRAPGADDAPALTPGRTLPALSAEDVERGGRIYVEVRALVESLYSAEADDARRCACGVPNICGDVRAHGLCAASEFRLAQFRDDLVEHVPDPSPTTSD